mmetsp:Transcript_52720/g.115588  ORF Transcript_52720/g.115588 Transcript_52720/m.115588 type:complete len:577 (+) Transcript_52720:41-1771(+)
MSLEERLVTAAINGNATDVDWLIGAGAFVHYADYQTGSTALEYAAAEGHLSVVRLLIPGTPQAARDSALREVVETDRSHPDQQQKIVQELVAAGALVDDDIVEKAIRSQRCHLVQAMFREIFLVRREMATNLDVISVFWRTMTRLSNLDYALEFVRAVGVLAVEERRLVDEMGLGNEPRSMIASSYIERMSGFLLNLTRGRGSDLAPTIANDYQAFTGLPAQDVQQLVRELESYASKRKVVLANPVREQQRKLAGDDFKNEIDEMNLREAKLRDQNQAIIDRLRLEQASWREKLAALLTTAEAARADLGEQASLPGIQDFDIWKGQHREMRRRTLDFFAVLEKDKKNAEVLWQQEVERWQQWKDRREAVYEDCNQMMRLEKLHSEQGDVWKKCLFDEEGWRVDRIDKLKALEEHELRIRELTDATEEGDLDKEKLEKLEAERKEIQSSLEALSDKASALKEMKEVVSVTLDECCASIHGRYQNFLDLAGPAFGEADTLRGAEQIRAEATEAGHRELLEELARLREENDLLHAKVQRCEALAQERPDSSTSTADILTPYPSRPSSRQAMHPAFAEEE